MSSALSRAGRVPARTCPSPPGEVVEGVLGGMDGAVDFTGVAGVDVDAGSAQCGGVKFAFRGVVGADRGDVLPGV